MHTTFLTPSLSRSGGGIFEAERRLGRALHDLPDVTLDVVGLRDEHTTEDLSAWSPLEPTVLSTVGPDALGYAPALLDTLLETNADLVHLHALWMYTSWAALQWHRRTGRPHIVSVHGMLDEWALANARWKKWIVGHLYENTSLRQAACLHALNDAEYQSIRDYGLDGPVCVIPNGVTLPNLDREPGPPPWREAFDDNASVLLFLGRIHPKKGLSELVDAWAAAADTLGKWRLAIIGWDDGDHVSALRSRIRKHDLSERIAVLGPAYGNDKAAAFRHADGFILPSHSEGLPMAVLEAWSYALPVLMTPQCNLETGFEAGAAYRVDPTPESLADGLRTFMTAPPDERMTMGRKGRVLVKNRYTWPQIARSMQTVYRWVLDDGPRPDCVYVD